MKPGFKRLAAALAALTLSVSVAGCGASAPSPAASTPGASTPASAPAAPAPDASTPAASGEKVLSVARDWEKTSMDPATWSNNNDLQCSTSVFETLLAYDDQLNPSPKLAETWDVSEDHLTYTFHLRKGVQFHHGYGEMKASDVAFTFEHMRDPNVNASYVIPALGLDNFKEITAVDDYTLQIKLGVPDSNMLYKFCEFYAYIISEKAVKELGNDGFAKKPVGTGPFQFDKGIAGEKNEVVKFAEYWGEPAKLDRIVFYTIPEPATAFNALEVGEIQFLLVSESDKIIEYQKNENYTVIDVPNRLYGNFGMNFSIKPFDDLRVRQAVCYAIDRETILSDYFQGLATGPTDYLSAGALFSKSGTFNPSYDPEKAKALLAEAGYPNGFDTQFYCVNDQISVGPSTIFQAYLATVGIRSELVTMDYAVFIENVTDGKAPIWFMWDGPDVIPDTWFYRWTSDAPRGNWCKFSDAEYDDAVLRGREAATSEEKKELFQKAQDRMGALLPYYPLYCKPDYYVMYKNVTGFKARPDYVFDFKNVDIA